MDADNLVHRHSPKPKLPRWVTISQNITATEWMWHLSQSRVSATLLVVLCQTLSVHAVQIRPPLHLVTPTFCAAYTSAPQPSGVVACSESIKLDVPHQVATYIYNVTQQLYMAKRPQAAVPATACRAASLADRLVMSEAFM